MGFRDRARLAWAVRRRVLAQLAPLILLLPWLAVAAATTPVAPAKLDLNTFDSLKRSVALADGETLAYVPLGAPKGPVVVLIHGYTDNARDWVPLGPTCRRTFA